MPSHLIKSMTGFGSAELTVGSNQIAVEIRSVNHRFFSPSIKMPSGFARLEGDVRELLRERVKRGHVTVSVRVGSEEAPGPQIDFDRVALYAEQVALLQKRLGITGPVNLDALLRLPQAVTSECVTADPDPEDVLKIVRHAVEEMDGVRATEGKKLTTIITDRLNAIEAAMTRVASRAPQRVLEQRDRLRKAVAALMDGAMPDEARIAQEIAMLADRLDVAEEIARFATHISAFRSTLDTPPPDGVGKRLGFLLQELLREANTTGSKASDGVIVTEVLAIKEDLERIREQVENLE